MNENLDRQTLAAIRREVEAQLKKEEKGTEIGVAKEAGMDFSKSLAGGGDTSSEKYLDQYSAKLGEAIGKRVAEAFGPLGEQIGQVLSAAIKGVGEQLAGEIKSQMAHRLDTPKEYAMEMAKAQAAAGVPVSEKDVEVWISQARQFSEGQLQAQKTVERSFAGEGSVLTGVDAYRSMAGTFREGLQDVGDWISDWQTEGTKERAERGLIERNRRIHENQQREGL